MSCPRVVLCPYSILSRGTSPDSMSCGHKAQRRKGVGEGVVALWLDSRMAWVYANLYVPLLNYAWRGACNRWPPGVWRLSYVCHQCVLQAVCPLGGCMCGYCACTYHGPSSAPSTPARAPPTPPAAFLRTGFHSVTVRWFAVGMALCVTTLLLHIGYDKPPRRGTLPCTRIGFAPADGCHGYAVPLPAC